GDIPFGSPLAVALASRGPARWALGRTGWRDDCDPAVALARGPTLCRVPASTPTPYGFAMADGVLLAHDAALRDLEEALEITQRWSEDFTLSYAADSGCGAAASGVPGGA